jgi:hypothetical protein
VRTAGLRLGLLAVLACTALARGIAEPPQLPPELSGYAEWKALLTEPAPVPVELWIRCVAPSAGDWQAAEESHGPHTQRFIQVYANRVAAAALPIRGEGTFPVGSILAKEKRLSGPDGLVDGVGFMIKRPVDSAPHSGGWEFLYYPEGQHALATHEACVACHRGAVSSDYVFGRYPQ